MSEETASMTLNDDIALVTGASRGIGKAIALKLGALGARIVGTATSDAGAAAIQAEFDANNFDGLGLCLNVTDSASVDAVMVAIQERFATPTVLVNNAGITRDNLLMRMKDEEWQAVIDTNLSSVFRLSKACLRGMMKARRGRIINIASVVGSTGNPGQTN
jgi:3-oxoacyl-[acyl-carrier protein] reductase